MPWCGVEGWRGGGWGGDMVVVIGNKGDEPKWRRNDWDTQCGAAGKTLNPVKASQEGWGWEWASGGRGVGVGVGTCVAVMRVRLSASVRDEQSAGGWGVSPGNEKRGGKKEPT